MGGDPVILAATVCHRCSGARRLGILDSGRYIGGSRGRKKCFLGMACCNLESSICRIGTATARYLDIHKVFKARFAIYWILFLIFSSVAGLGESEKQRHQRVSSKQTPTDTFFPEWLPTGEADQRRVKCRAKISGVTESEKAKDQYSLSLLRKKHRVCHLSFVGYASL